MRVLVVEDEHRIANAIKKGLEQERYAADAAYSGPDGYDMAAGEEYDLVILDLMLPGMDGVEICRRLRAKNIHTPILMLTARGQTGDKVAGLDAGADDYLTKPFSFEELLARVRALMRRPKEAVSEVMVAGGLELDLKKYVARREGRDIPLSAKEFSLLEYLMRHSGQVLTKDQIISHVWNYEADVLPNTVEVYIKSLRDKIDRPFAGVKPVITTLRGFGYKVG